MRANKLEPIETLMGLSPQEGSWTPTREGDHYAYCRACLRWLDVRKPSEVADHREHPLWKRAEIFLACQ